MKNCTCKPEKTCLNSAMEDLDLAMDRSWRIDQIVFLGLGYAAIAAKRRSSVLIKAKGLTIEEAVLALAEMIRADLPSSRSSKETSQR
jgi:hypothetical protein